MALMSLPSLSIASLHRVFVLPRWHASLPPLARMLEAARSRRLLAGLDERALKDLGLSQADVMREARRLPWDLSPPGV